MMNDRLLQKTIDIIVLLTGLQDKGKCNYFNTIFTDKTRIFEGNFNIKDTNSLRTKYGIIF